MSTLVTRRYTTKKELPRKQEVWLEKALTVWADRKDKTEDQKKQFRLILDALMEQENSKN